MGRLIDADLLRKESKMLYSIHAFEPVEAYTQDQIDNAPTADAVRVVRCEKCRYRGYECSIHREGSFYCADGERKAGGPSAAEHSHEIAGKAHNNAGSEAAENER